MKYKFLLSLYNSLPPALQSVSAYVPFSLLAGSKYRRTLRRDRQIRSLDRNAVSEIQAGYLLRTLSHAVQYVPRYKHLRSTVESKHPFLALQSFPVITKAEIEANPDEFTSANYNQSTYTVTTGGTTGKQFNILLDNGSQSIEIAFLHRIWAQYGYTSRSRKATFRGVDFRQLSKNCYWQYNPIYNELQYSPFHLSTATLPHYLNSLLSYDPEFLHGYPSALAFLADSILSLEVPFVLPSLKAIFLCSESITDANIRCLKSAFNVPICTWYGHSERLILAECLDDNQTYHQIPDYGYLEILDPATFLPSYTGELVGTTFHNFAMPLIRYRTGDLASSNLNTTWPSFSSIQGRWNYSSVIGCSGYSVSITALNTHSHLLNCLERYQFFQDTPGYLVLKVIPKSPTTFDPKSIQDYFEQKLDLRYITFIVSVVTSIPLTVRGKLPLFVSKL